MKRQSEAIIVPEVLRPAAMERRRAKSNTDLVRALVQEQVAEILAARDEFVLEPFFRTRQVAHEIRRLQTVPERKKWAVYFERKGCLSCHKQNQPHASNGLCNTCHAQVFRELKEIVSELMKDSTGKDGEK